MPHAHQLSNDLKELCDRQAEFVEYRTFDTDVERLIKKLRPGGKPQPVPVKSGDGRIETGAAIVHGVPDGRFLPGNGKSEWFKDHQLAPEMVVIPKGQFIMGSPADEEGRDDNEGPQHQVVIKAPFALGRFAITLAEFGAFVKATGRAMPGERLSPAEFAAEYLRAFMPGPHYPVVGRGWDVDWEDAVAYCQWLAETTGKDYRLPSEAEWEYACRAGTSTPFWCGSTISTDEANFNGEFTYAGGKKGQYRRAPAPVESYKPNPWGLYQVHGNVMEWCSDNWHENYRGAPEDGSVWQGGDATRHVLRGGSWWVGPRRLRAAARRRPSYSSIELELFGFRVARTILTPRA